MAEAHPVGFRWVMKAKEKGATIIHVDPRFSRTSAMADLWVPIRAGSDIVFFGALIRHVLETDQYFREYVVSFTNAAYLLKNDFRDAEHGAGFFSGWQEEGQHYDPTSWAFEGGPDPSKIERDVTLQHPRCVFQALKRHYQRYTPEMVQTVCGIPPELFQKVADAMTSNSGRERTTAHCYAVGYTHQSKGVQIIRSAAVLQTLLGNIGRPGGGIMALRGHASIQGSTDIPTLYDTLPGYLSMPTCEPESKDLASFLKKYTQETGLWHDTPKYVVSLLKAYYGKRATKENDFGFDWLPKLTGDHSHFPFVMRMCNHEVDGYFIMGQNPAVGSQNARLQRQALARVKWLVVRDLVEIESASFWYQAPEIERGEMKTEDIATEVFLMPAASHVEKEGRSPTRSACSSGAKKPSRRPAMPRARHGSPTNSPNGSSPERWSPPTQWTSRCVRWTGGIPKTRKVSRRPKRFWRKSTGGKLLPNRKTHRVWLRAAQGMANCTTASNSTII